MFAHPLTDINQRVSRLVARLASAYRLRMRPTLPVRSAMWFVALVIASAGCSASESPRVPAQPSPSGKQSNQKPQPSVEQALDSLLRTEQRGDFGGSYAFMSRRHSKYPAVAQWIRRRKALPDVTGFTIVSSAGNVAIVTVRHKPALDPFLGLTAGQERQTWKGRRENGGWLLESEPRVTVVLPGDGAARDAAERWTRALQHCDQSGARALQAVDQLFGDVGAAARVCGSAGPITAKDVQRLPSGPPSADIVDQYSTDALNWARVVSIAGAASFRVVLAPLGDHWEVIGILPKSV